MPAVNGCAIPTRARSAVCFRRDPWADMLMIDGDPTQDIDGLQEDERNVGGMSKGGKIFKNTPREDEEFILYRGHAKQAEAPSVLLLAPVSIRPALESLKKIEHEYSFRSELDATWAVRPLALSQYNEQRVLVLENPGGEPLNRLVQGPMEMRQFLRFAIGLATALSQLHKRELIHKDVKPPNVLVDSATGQVWLTGFGIVSRLPRERQSPEPPEFIAGTLPYMAPEQTGQMNRSIDSRSDLYALGIMLYEMLTGSLPFTASDPLMRKLEAIRQAGAIAQEIVLAPLARDDLGRLIADALHCEPERPTPLAQLIHDKTAGNPFFAIQFISALAEEALLTFDHGEGRWSW
jgi:serine/threonine protein kinase